jgi:hypothetical protein
MESIVHNVQTTGGLCEDAKASRRFAETWQSIAKVAKGPEGVFPSQYCSSNHDSLIYDMAIYLIYTSMEKHGYHYSYVLSDIYTSWLRIILSCIMS